MSTHYPLSARIDRSFLRSILLLSFLSFHAVAWPQLSTVFNSSGTFTVPIGVTTLTVECWGGGGHGGTCASAAAGGGGGGGAYARRVLAVSGGTTYTVTVGAGSSTAAPGGDSWFGTSTTVLARGGASVPNESPTGAPGGTAAASIGDVTYSGGTGRTTGNDNGGGGGSSAGTAANGNNATSYPGAVAPTGGGNGGDGGAGLLSVPGGDGAGPGGGGGGARRILLGTIAGGNGGNGRVVVTYPVQGACMPALPANTMPDLGCLSLPLAISGLPTALGTAPGQVRLLSVKLIISHTYNADLKVTLTSPAGTARDLIVHRFGSGTNIGDPSSCPGSALLLRDGGTALTNAAMSNVTGIYAPEQTLAGFSGDPNGTWTITVCDDVLLDVGALRYIQLDFCTVPSITGTTSDSPVCSNGALTLGATATGTAPLAYAWTGTGTFSPSNAVQAPSVTGAASGNYGLTVSNACGSANANVAVTVTPAPAATIGYAGSPYCSNEGTASVTRTGTAGGAYTSTPGLAIDSGTGAVDLGASTPGTYTVTYTIAAAGGCAVFTTTADITIDAALTYYRDADGDGLGDPDDHTTSCAPVPGYVTNDDDLCPAAFGTVGSACDDGDANTTDDTLDAACLCTGTNTPWYSQDDGTFADPIWSHDISGPGGPATIDAGSIVLIQPGDTVGLAGMQDVLDLTVQSGGALDLAGHTLNVHGTTLAIHGALLAGPGSRVRLVGSGPTTLSTTGSPDFRDLTVSTPMGTTVSGAVDILGTLLLDEGTFDATNATVRLRSTINGTGSLGPVATEAAYVGDLTVQRYVPNGATNWRLLSCPVQGATVESWDDDFITAGYPGSDYPNFFDPPGSGILWPSVREYDESQAGAMSIGMHGVASGDTPLDPGKGFSAWCGDALGGTAAFIIDVTGPPVVAIDPLMLPVTYTDHGDPANDGWNLVGDPLPSAIDFSLMDLGSGLYNGYSIYDPSTGTMATWDAATGISTPAGRLNGIIASSQGFWLKATGPSPGPTWVDEHDKTSTDGGGLFGREGSAEVPTVRLLLSGSANSFSDEAVVAFRVGTPAFDAEDAPKLRFHHAEAPQIATLAAGGEPLAINKYGTDSTAVAIPVQVDAAVTGTYTITAQLSGTGLRCFWLEDLVTGAALPIADGASHAFTLSGNDPEEVRFLLHALAPLPLLTQDGLCGDSSATAQVMLGDTPADVAWSTAAGTVLLQHPGITGDATCNGLSTGSYTVRVDLGEPCGPLTQDFSVTSSGSVPVADFLAPDLLLVNEPATFTNLGLPDAQYTWDFGDGHTSDEASPTHTYALPGTYLVTLMAASGPCTDTVGRPVSVVVSTDMRAVAPTGLKVWASARAFVVEHGFTGAVDVDVFDATGILHRRVRSEATPGRILLPTEGLNAGIWFVRVDHAGRQTTFRVPLMH